MRACKYSLILFFISLMFGHLAAQETTVYVWEFFTRDNKNNDLTKAFTEDFESALVDAKCYTVLNRRNYASLVAQQDMEKEIRSVDDVSEETKSEFRTKAARQFIFGEIFDDVESGEIRITVTFQAFNGSIITRKHVSLARGLRLDANSRIETMKALAKKLCRKPARAPAEYPISHEIDGFTVILKECRFAGGKVTMLFDFISIYGDEKVRLAAGSQIAYDDAGNKHISPSVKIASQKSNNLERLFVIDVAVPVEVHWKNVPGRAVMISRYDLKVEINGNEQQLTYRNLPLLK